MIIDGGIGEAGSGGSSGDVVKLLDPKAIAEAALALTRQPSTAWSFEVDLHPKNEPW
jgi:hypothetical protein